MWKLKVWKRLKRITGALELLPLLRTEIKLMSEELNRLIAEVSETRGVVNSAITLLNGLGQQIRDHIDDPAALAQLANDLDQQQTDLAAAVQANTTEPTE